MDPRKSVIFAFRLVKAILQTTDTIHCFRDLVLVCKIHDCYCTILKIFEHFHSFPSSNTSDCNGWATIWIKANYFKILLNVFSTTYNNSNCIVYRLLYCWKISSPTFVAKKGRLEWIYYCSPNPNPRGYESVIAPFLLAIWKALENTEDKKKMNVLCIKDQIMRDLWL